MTAIIADILKETLSELDWIERFAGMVTPATRPVFVTVEGGQQVVTGYETFPVACDVNEAQCWEGGQYKTLMPDGGKGAVAFFTESSGVSLKDYGGPKHNELTFSFELKFLCWVNTRRLTSELTGGTCNVAGRVAPYVISRFWGQHSAADVYGPSSPEAAAFQRIEVKSIRQLPKTPDMFSPFTFASPGDRRGLFLYPYDYFGLVVGGQFVMNRACLPDLYEAPFVFTDPATCIDT